MRKLKLRTRTTYSSAVGSAGGDEIDGGDSGSELDLVTSNTLKSPGGQGRVVHGECSIGKGVLYGCLHIAVKHGWWLQIPPVCNITPGHSLTPSLALHHTR
mgnify:CR=1 FL=1